MSLWLCRDVPAGSPALPYLLERRDGTARVDGASIAFAANPAALRDGNGLVYLRLPTTTVGLLEPDGEGGYRLRERLRRDGYSLQAVSYGVALGEKTRLLADVSFRQAGRFTRVDQEGISVHAFPETDWMVGAGLSHRVSGRLAVGATANWLRTKQALTPERTRYAHGWVFDVGMVGIPSSHARVGVVARNLGNGIARLGEGVPTEPRRQVLVGGTLRQRISPRLAVEWAADVRVPSKRGAQAAGEATLLLGDGVGVTVGYQRLVERWRTISETSSGDVRSDERLWVAEGWTFGASARLGRWRLSGGARPIYLPRVGDRTRREIGGGRWQWAVGVASLR